MKKLIVAGLFLSIFIGCGEDDQGEALIGTWIGQFQEVSNCVNDPEAISTTNLRCNTSTCFRLELNADGTFSYQQGTLVERGTYSGNFKNLSLCMDEEGVTECVTYTVIENTSATLFISTMNDATECITAIFFEKEIVDDDSEA